MTNANETAINSQGSALKENTKVVDSIAGHTARFNNALDELFTNTLNSDSIKNILDFATALIKVVDAVGIINIVLGILMVAIGIKFPIIFATASASIAAFATSMGVSLTVMTGWIGAITALIVLIGSELVKAIDDAYTSQKEYNDLINEQVISINELEAEIKDYEDRLSDLTYKEKLYLDTMRAKIELEKEYQELLKIDKYKDMVESLRKAALSADDFYAMLATGQNIEDDEVSALARYQVALDTLGKKFGSTSSEVAGLKVELAEEYEELTKAKKLLGIEFPKTLDAYMFKLKAVLTVTSGVKDETKSLSDVIADAIKNGEDIDEAINNYINALTSLGDSYDDTIVSTNLYIEALSELSEEGKVSEATMDSLIGSQNAVQFALNATKEEIEKLAEAYGYTGNDIATIQQMLTNEVIKQTRARMMAIATEYLALEEQAKNIMASGGTLTMAQQRALYGSGSRLGEFMMDLDSLYTRLDGLDVMYSKVTDKKDSSAKATEDEIDVLKEYNDTISEQTALLKQLESEKEAINDLVDLTVGLIEKENELYKEQLSDRKEALKLAKDEADLQKELADLNVDRSKLQSELMTLRLDDSENNKARILEIEDDLAKSTLTIDEKLEEDAYNAKVKVLDDEISAVDDYLSKEGAIRQDAMDRINESFKNGTQELFDDLVNYNDIYGSSIQQDIVDAWQAASAAVQSYGGDLSALSAISDSTIKAQMALNSAKWHTTEVQSEKDSYHSANKILANQLTDGSASFDSGSGVWNLPTSTSGMTPDINSSYSSQVPISSYQVPNIGSSSSSGDTSIGSLITIQGNVDSSVMSRLESAASQVADALKNVNNMQGMNNISIM